MSLPETSAAQPPAWGAVLEQIEHALQEAVTATAERERAVDAVFGTEEARAQRDAEWQALLARLTAAPAEDPLRRLEQTAADADASLAGAEEALRRWLAEAARVGEMLAPPAGRGL